MVHSSADYRVRVLAAPIREPCLRQAIAMRILKIPEEMANASGHQRLKARLIKRVEQVAVDPSAAVRQC